MLASTRASTASRLSLRAPRPWTSWNIRRKRRSRHEQPGFNLVAVGRRDGGGMTRNQVSTWLQSVRNRGERHGVPGRRDGGGMTRNQVSTWLQSARNRGERHGVPGRRDGGGMTRNQVS